MNILNKINRDERYFALYNTLDSLHDRYNGLYGVMDDSFSINITIPTSIRYKTVSDTLSEFGLESFSDDSKITSYINILNLFSYFNNINKNDYICELFSSIGTVKGFDNLLEKLEPLRLENYNLYKNIFDNMDFSRYSNAKIKTIKNKETFKKEILNYFDKFQKNELKLRLENLDNLEFNSRYMNSVFKLLTDTYIGKKYNLDTELEYFDKNYNQISREEKLEWLKRNNPSLIIYDIDVFGKAKKINEMLGLNALFNPEGSKIKYISDKYQSLVDSIRVDEKNCRLYKTILYLSMYMLRNTKGAEKLEPIEYLNKILDRNTAWAVGTEKTTNPSFYGKEDAWKAFYGYAPFMTGDKNLYREVIDNSEVDEMDTYAQMMHKYFKNSENSIIYDLLFEEGIIGDKSIYETLEMAKDLIQLIEDPIVASSVINDALTKLKGIISSIINSAVSSLDLSLSEVVRKLFYVKFIPISGKKYTLQEIHNYVAFIKAILETFEHSEDINAIGMDEFINKVYLNLGHAGDQMKRYGYCSYDKFLNEKIGLGMHEKHLEKNKEGNFYYFKNDSKVVYSIIQFGIQKHIHSFGGSFTATIDYGDRYFIKKMVSSLTENELFYVMNTHGINFYNFNQNFNSFKEEELLTFNANMNDIAYFQNHATDSSDFYKSFLDKDEAVLIVEKNNKSFNNVHYKRFIDATINVYFKYVDKNKNNLTKAVFEANDVSDVDDFLMRFLPSLKELAKTFGQDNVSVGSLIKMLDYFCNFITDVLFRDCFIKVKLFINEKVKAFSEDMFTVIDKLGTKDVIVSFDIGGSVISKKIDALLKMMQDIAISTSILSECFKNPNVNSVDTSKLEDKILEYIDKIESEKGKNKVTVEEFEKHINITIDENYKEKETIVNESTNESFIENIIKNETVYEEIVGKNDNLNKKPDKIIYDDGDIYIEKEDGAKITLVSKEDSIDKGKINISDKNDTINNSEVFEKIIDNNLDEIGKLITIRDFIKSTTSIKIIEAQNDLNKVKDNLNKELNKTKPNMSVIKDLMKEEVRIIEVINKLTSDSNGYYSGFKPSQNIAIEETKIEIHDFSNGEFSIEQKIDVLSELNDFATNEKIPLTNAQITELLR